MVGQNADPCADGQIRHGPARAWPDGQDAVLLACLRDDHVLNHPMLKSTAISDAGLTNQTIFEVERSQFTRSTYDRALESVDSVNAEIEALIKKAWGRAA